MLDIKLNTIKFLMTMFDSSCGNSSQVLNYKIQVEELVRRNQLSPAIKRLIYSLYGIENTDVFKPSIQSQKLMQVNMLMGMGEMAYKDNRLMAFKGIIDDGVKSGSILKSARDFIFGVFELDTIKTSSEYNSSVGLNEEPEIKKTEARKKKVSEVLDSKNTSERVLTRSAEVKADIAKIKPEYLSEVYYEWENPSYTGCSGESRTLHARLDNAVSKHKGATLVYRKEIGDPCLHNAVYYDIPKSWYKPESKPEPKRVNTPIGDPCSGGGFGRSSC